MKISVKLVLLFTLTNISSSYAIKYYGATLEKSIWKVVDSSPIECELVHDIPLFGSASFTVKASKKINLTFALKMLFAMGSIENVSLIFMPAPWIQGSSVGSFEEFRFYKQFDGYLDGQAAWNMLSELEMGNFPTFTYRQWQSNNRKVSVYLSSVAFDQPYSEFQQCVAKLLPYSFEDIAFTTLHYTENGEDFTEAAKEKLTQITQYVQHTQDIELVLMSSYTDSQGTQKENLEITEIRAKKLEEHFISIGLAKDRIQVQAFGESRTVAVNDTVKGRNQNRRIVISLARNIF